MQRSAGLWVRRFGGRPPTLVALHGFTQTGAMYAELAEALAYEVLAPDLPGHGRSAGFLASFESAVNAVAELLAEAGAPTPLLGYSQGGRVALAVALQRPELVSHLVVVSTTPGIENEVERAERRRSDEAQAAELETGGLPAFLDKWLSRPMFDGLDRRGAAWRAADQASRLDNTAEGLAAALVGMGQGAQPYYGERLRDLGVPVLVIAGELDEDYVALGAGMCRSLRQSSFGIVSNAGHAVIGEHPEEVADLVSGFLAGRTG